MNFKKILVAVDGSANAERAAAAAIEIAKNNRARLVILNVAPIFITPPAEYVADLSAYLAAAEEQGKEIVDRLAKLANSVQDVKTAVVKNPGSTVQAIVSFAEHEGVNLIVLGTRGQGGFKKLLMGSVSTGVLNHASCSVLVVR